MRYSIISVASAILSLSTLTQASPVENRAVQTVTGWDYQGCYTDLVKARSLTGSFYFDNILTVEKCAIACNKFTYFGVEFGHECFCGNTLNAPSVLASESECNYNCAGKTSVTCGAAPRYVFQIFSDLGNGQPRVSSLYGILF